MNAQYRTVKIGDFDVHLQSLFGEYNCGNKTCGRLTLVATKENDSTNYGAASITDALEQKDIRDQIIKNFLLDLDNRSLYTTLAAGCGFFPGDTGTYPPGVLLYADRVQMGAHIKWYNNWKGLIEVFEDNPDFGVQVIKSPILPNRFYGAGTPSRVWMVVLPTISKHVAWDKNHITAEMKNGLQGLTNTATPRLKEELKQLGVA